MKTSTSTNPYKPQRLPVASISPGVWLDCRLGLS
jgi:hypothetical protein